MRAADGPGDTLGLKEKAPSRGMRYLENITNKFYVATEHALSPTRTNTLWKKDVQRKEGTTHHVSMAHVSALGLVLLAYCSMLQQMGVEAKAGQQNKIEWTRPHARLVHTIKNLHRRRKGHAHPHPSFSWHAGRIITNQASIRSKIVFLASKGHPISVFAWENITSSMNFLFNEKASLTKWSEIRVCGLRKYRSRA